MRSSILRRLGEGGAAKPVPVRINLLSDLREMCAKELTREGFAVAQADSTEAVVRSFVNVQLRRIVPRVRPASWSRELRAREPGLGDEYRRALARIEAASQKGDDLTPYLSRKLVGKRKKATFTDHSLCDWDIHHLHLGDGLDADGKVRGTNELLFAVARDEALYFIDVLEHSSFGDQYLFDTVLANWPRVFGASEMPTVARSRTPHPPVTAAQRAILRSKGINALTVGADGLVYHPVGGGIARDGSAIRVTVDVDRVWAAVTWEERVCRDHAEEIRNKIHEATGTWLDVLDLKLVHAGGGVFKVLETQTNVLVTPTP